MNRHQMGFVLLGSALLANPVVLFILTGNIYLTIAVPVAVFLAIRFALTRFGTGLPTIYVVNTLAFLSVLVHAETLFRSRFDYLAVENLYDDYPGYYFNKPLLVKKLTDKEYAVDYLTNKDGFRIGYSQFTDVSFNTIDWLFIGDSFTQGAQVQFEELYTTQLYRLFPNKIVANAGISGFGLPEEYELASTLETRYKPEILFLQISAFNDFMKVRKRTTDFSDWLVQKSDFARYLLQGFKYINPAALPLGRWVEPFYPTEEENRKYNVFYNNSSPEKEADLREFRKYLSLAVTTAARNGTKLVLLFLPTKEQIRYRYLSEVVDGFKIDPGKLDMYRPNRIVRALADTLGCDLIDVTEAFEAAPYDVYFRFDEHLTPAGHLLLADQIRKHLNAKGITPAYQILSTEYGGDRYPSAAESGRSILFQGPVNGNSELFIADSLLQGRRQITVDAVDESHPVLSPNGILAYTEGDQARGATKVVLSDLSANSRKAIPSDSVHYGAIPDISQDGTWLTYAEWGKSGRRPPSSPVIVLYHIPDGERQTVSPEGPEAWRPVFAPQGDRIAYIRKDGGEFDIFLVHLQTRREQRLTETPFDEWDPRFSPDGQRLVYAAKADGQWDLFEVDLNTIKTRRLTSTHCDEWDPSYSADGRVILFGAECGIWRGIYRLQLSEP